jgi:hypothetical protein
LFIQSLSPNKRGGLPAIASPFTVSFFDREYDQLGNGSNRFLVREGKVGDKWNKSQTDA